MKLLLILSAAVLFLTTTANAFHIPERVKIHESGIYAFTQDDLSIKFRPADDFDLFIGAGKGYGLSQHQDIKKYFPPENGIVKTSHRPFSAPVFDLPPGLIDNPACDRSQGRLPWFCHESGGGHGGGGNPDQPNVNPVPIPAAVWFLLSALWSLTFFRKKDS